MSSERHSTGLMTKLIAGLYLFIFMWALVAGIAYIAAPEKNQKEVIGALKRLTVIIQGKASGKYPVNTLQFFERAIAIDGDAAIKLDVRKTYDGNAVVSSESSVDNGGGRRERINEMTLEKLKGIDAGRDISCDNGKTFPFRGKGFRMAALAEFLDRFPSTVKYIVIRDSDPLFAESVLNAVKSRGQTDKVIIGAERRVLPGIREKYPEFAVAFSEEDAFSFMVLQKLQLTGFSSLQGDVFIMPEYSESSRSEKTGRKKRRGLRLVTPSFISTAHRYGIPVIVRDISREDRLQQMILWGIDGIVTDYTGDFYRRAGEEGVLSQ